MTPLSARLYELGSLGLPPSHVAEIMTKFFDLAQRSQIGPMPADVVYAVVGQMPQRLRLYTLDLFETWLAEYQTDQIAETVKALRLTDKAEVMLRELVDIRPISD